ncbi:hypothetical protein ECMP0209801_4173 [Escherichia coli MP020980.1]|nr:hypothetical protein EC2845650_1194 [Escherichia coli 2845650]ENB14445.1 hypothetical protein EC2875150_1271 [Escherichia coli 2875150]END50310.1 hypothetical protein ECMP0209801_4173 [Escherichia coli MP020980.1]
MYSVLNLKTHCQNHIHRNKILFRLCVIAIITPSRKHVV